MMRSITLVLLALVITAGWAGADCPPPDGFDSSTQLLAQAGDEDAPLTIIADGKNTQVSALSTFWLERVEGNAFYTERFRVRAYCDTTTCTWVPVTGTTFNYEVGDEPVRLEVNLPQTYTVQRDGETFKTIAKELSKQYGRLVTEQELRVANSQNRSYVRKGQTIMVAPPEEPIWVWSYAGGDKAGKELKEQIWHFTVPEEVQQLWLAQVEATKPEVMPLSSTAEEPLILNGLAFGGRAPGSKFKVVNTLVLCRWDGKTELTAKVYPPIVHEGVAYQLMQFEECDNGAYIKTSVRITPEIEVPPPPAPPTEAPPPPPVTYRVRKNPVSRENRDRGVLWIDQYLYEPEGDDNTQHGSYAGIELGIYPRGDQRTLGLRRLGIVPRIEQAYDGVHEYRKGGNHSGWYSLGAEFRLLQRSGFIVTPSLGAWYGANQRSWTEYTQVSPDTMAWKRDRRYFDDYGWYARLNVVGPLESYSEGWLRQGKFWHDRNASLTLEPGWFYGKLSAGQLRQEEQSRHFDGKTLTMSADTMRVYQARLGFKPTRKLVLFAQYEDQKYDSKFWGVDNHGPGAGFEYRYDNGWRLKGDVTDFGHHLNHDKVNDRKIETELWRWHVGLDYHW